MGWVCANSAKLDEIVGGEGFSICRSVAGGDQLGGCTGSGRRRGEFAAAGPFQRSISGRGRPYVAAIRYWFLHPGSDFRNGDIHAIEESASASLNVRDFR